MLLTPIYAGRVAFAYRYVRKTRSRSENAESVPSLEQTYIHVDTLAEDFDGFVEYMPKQWVKAAGYWFQGHADAGEHIS